VPLGKRSTVEPRQKKFYWREGAFPSLAFLALAASLLPAGAQGTNLEEQIRLLQQQNATLQEQLQKQNKSLESLEKKVEDLETAKSESAPGHGEAPEKSGFNLGKVNLSGEGGLAFFNTGSQGFAPHSEFRVDEARLFAEAPIWKEVYFFGETDFATRENTDLNLHMGELYLDFEDVSQLWGHDGQLNFRIGRINLPFGEEYLTRYAVENPLITHSVSDLWGFDSGAEIYGALGKFTYVAAVQNGSGKNGVQDFDGDKSVTGRIGFNPNHSLHFSVSGMRTGNMDATGDFISALWFGNGFFQSLGGPGATKFHANLVEGDMTARWSQWLGGHITAFGGYARYGDNDPAADHGRDIFYYSVEGVQNLPRKFYVATRFSEVLCQDGVPIMGLGDGAYFSALTKDLWRLSLGAGYRFSEQLQLKLEYAIERGKTLSGESRDNEDFVGTEATFKF
jgi:hypothetical protein